MWGKEWFKAADKYMRVPIGLFYFPFLTFPPPFAGGLNFVECPTGCEKMESLFRYCLIPRALPPIVFTIPTQNSVS